MIVGDELKEMKIKEAVFYFKEYNGDSGTE
jgi:hypothetical protein